MLVEARKERRMRENTVQKQNKYWHAPFLPSPASTASPYHHPTTHRPGFSLQYRSENNIVCVEVLRPSQPIWVLSSVVSLPKTHTFFWEGLVLLAINQYLCTFFHQKLSLNQQKGENDGRKYLMINLHERMLPAQWELNLRPPDYQWDAHQTDSPKPALTE